MKKYTFLLLSSVLLLGTVACQNVAKTSADAPNNTVGSPSASTPVAGAMKDAKQDAMSDTRQAQLNADIRAREQRNNITGGDTQRADGDLESEVRSKLEANIPRGLLAVNAKDGVVTVSGTVPDQKELSTVDNLAKQVKGVKSVINKATVAKPK